MDIDLSGISLSPPDPNRTLDPLSIFDSLTLRGAIENIWNPQAEALRRWHENRDEPDVTIEMNTGGGKTLVGLLAAQSLTNETQRGTFYVCPTNQLIEQTREQAAECGLDVATYYRSQWTDRAVYDEARGPAITNYAALFNGRSKFFDEDIAGIIFDDAHVAGGTIRSQFTVRIPPGYSDLGNLYSQIVQLFRPYFQSSNQAEKLRNALEGNWEPLLFVPGVAPLSWTLCRLGNST